MTLLRILCTSLILVTVTMQQAQTANILGLFAHPSESHFAVMRSFTMELARRGHNVTVYSSHRLNERIENLQEIVIEPEYPFWQEVQKNALGKGTGGLQQLSSLPVDTLQKTMGQVGGAATDYFLSNTAVQLLLTQTSNEFNYDLIVVDLFYTESLLALGYAHRTPTVALVSTDFEQYMQHVLESIVPLPCLPNDKDRTAESVALFSGYWQRLGALRNCMYRRKQFAKWNVATQEQLLQKHFSAHFKGGNVPSVTALQAELTLLLLNTHVPLAQPRPLLPNTIHAGGMHVRATRELPWHIRRFLDESRIGVIYMNLGNEELCAEVPQQRLKSLFAALGARREHVLWTCHDVQKIDGMPENFMLQHMVPQSDILAHPHVKVFITNGDLLAVQEGILRQVPLLGLPLFRHESHYMDIAVQLSIGLKIDYADFTADSLGQAVQSLLLKQDYQIAVRAVSKEFRDRPLGALETCMYWIDYVLRHNGGAALKAQGLAISNSQLHVFDLLIFYIVLTVIYVGLVGGIFYAIFAFVSKRRKQKGLKIASKFN